MNKTVYRFLINWYQAADKPLPAWLERACSRHPDLASERDLGDELTKSLRKRPNDATPLAGDSMASRVLRQITEEDYLAEQQQQQNTGSARWGLWVRNAGLVTAAFAVALVAYHYLETPEQTPAGNESRQIAKLDPEKVDQVAEEALELKDDWKNPLDQEIEYIVSDAKGAIGFLAASFVPSTYLKKAESGNNA